MKWVTRKDVHLDRVAAPWLIRRFIDREAVFEFVPAGSANGSWQGAIPFGLPNVELSAHDAAGSTFRKLLRKYDIRDAALDMIADIVEAGIAHVLSEGQPPETGASAPSLLEGVGLEAISRGMAYLALSDSENIAASAVIYDALYLYCQARIIEKKDPDLGRLPFVRRVRTVRERLAAERS